MSSCELTLRPHHALCAGFFRGKGYSEAFVANMTEVVGMLHASDPLLTLRSSADAVCRCCPHNAGGICDSADKAARYDSAVLRLTGLRDGAQLRWSELASLTRERILSAGRLSEVCGGCQWHGVCEGAANKSA